MAEDFKRERIIDARGHFLGRLSALVAKNLLNGQNVTVVRCEDLLISGNFYQNKLKFLDYLRKRTRTQPRRGPFHQRAPAKIFARTVRGMLPHKRKRGILAYKRLKAYKIKAFLRHTISNNVSLLHPV